MQVYFVWGQVMFAFFILIFMLFYIWVVSMNKIKKYLNFRNIFATTFTVLGVLKVLCDDISDRIDIIVIMLFVIAYLPWLSKYLKKLELYGLKVDFNIPDNDKSKMDKIAEKIDVTINNNINNNERNSYQVDDIYRLSDDNSRLVLIRYEIEKELKRLCMKNNIINYPRNIRGLCKTLSNEKIISNESANLILDLLPILNNAVHSNNTNYNTPDFDWVSDMGVKMIIYLRSL